MPFPDAWLGLWIAPRKAVWIERDGESFRVTVCPGPGERPYRRGDLPEEERLHYTYPPGGAQHLAARWVTHAGRAPLRIPTLRVEAEASGGRGRTYELAFSVGNPADVRYRCRAASGADPLSAIRLVPTTGPSFVDAVSPQGDEGEIPWALPLEPLRKASPPDEETYLRAREA